MRRWEQGGCSARCAQAPLQPVRGIRRLIPPGHQPASKGQRSAVWYQSEVRAFMQSTRSSGRGGKSKGWLAWKSLKGCSCSSPTWRSSGPPTAGLLAGFYQHWRRRCRPLSWNVGLIEHMDAALVRLYLQPAFHASVNVIIVVDESAQDAMLEVQSGTEVKAGSVPCLVASELVGIAHSAVSGAERFRPGIDGIVVSIFIEIDGKPSVEGSFWSPLRGSLCAELVNAVAVAASSSLLLGPELERSISAIQGYFH